jgi:hypothetical protein
VWTARADDILQRFCERTSETQQAAENAALHSNRAFRIVKTWGCEILKGVWNADVVAHKSYRIANCCAQRGRLISQR